MNIGIDGRLLERKMSGIGRFLNTLLLELPSIDKNNKYFLFTYEKLKISQDFYSVVPTFKSFLPQKLFSPFWINFILPFYLKKQKIDIFFSVNQLLPLAKVRNTKYILVLHDVIYKVDKSFHPFIYRKYLQFFTYFAIKSADVIITVSDYSKKDILRYYKLSPEKIKVVYEAADKEFKDLNLSLETKSNIRKKIELPEHTVLYVGMIENRKNIIGILNIADMVYKKYPEVKFLLIGKIGYGGKKILNELSKRKNVLHLINVDDKMLKHIYNIAYLFLFPSFYEGFGFPPLEAMQSGVPVLASNTTSLKEILGSSAILHDPNDYDSFARDIIKLIGDKNWYNEIRSLGFQRARMFQINSTAKEIVNLFNSFDLIPR